MINSVHMINMQTKPKMQSDWICVNKCDRYSNDFDIDLNFLCLLFLKINYERYYKIIRTSMNLSNWLFSTFLYLSFLLLVFSIWILLLEIDGRTYVGHHSDAKQSDDDCGTNHSRLKNRQVDSDYTLFKQCSLQIQWLAFYTVFDRIMTGATHSQMTQNSN